MADYNIELHMVRHGQDDINKLGGWSDNHLTSEGEKQIFALLDIIDDDYDAFISSDLIRAIETSDILNFKLKMEIIYDSSYREVNNGVLKNLTKSEFDDRYPSLYFSSLGMNEAYPEGESPNSFCKRVEDAFFKLLNEHKGKKILLVTHGGVITVILCLINGYPYSNKVKIAPGEGQSIKL